MEGSDPDVEVLDDPERRADPGHADGLGRGALELNAESLLNSAHSREEIYAAVHVEELASVADDATGDADEGLDLGEEKEVGAAEDLDLDVSDVLVSKTDVMQEVSYLFPSHVRKLIGAIRTITILCSNVKSSLWILLLRLKLRTSLTRSAVGNARGWSELRRTKSFCSNDTMDQTDARINRRPSVPS